MLGLSLLAALAVIPILAQSGGGYDLTWNTLDGGGVKCWGANMYGQLGSNSETFSPTPVDVDGLANGVTAIAAGETHTCALVSECGVKCWGDNVYGELGDGTRANGSVMPVNVIGLSGGVIAIAAGGLHTCALVGTGRPYCWGLDGVGELGIGTKVISFSTTPVDLVEAGPLTRNYPNGQPGSFITITGWNFPPDSQATLSINGQIITNSLSVYPTGSFLFFLDTDGAEQGLYVVTVGANPEATTSFVLAGSLPLRSQEGGGLTFTVPGGIAYRNFFYVPLAMR